MADSSHLPQNCASATFQNNTHTLDNLQDIDRDPIEPIHILIMKSLAGGLKLVQDYFFDHGDDTEACILWVQFVMERYQSHELLSEHLLYGFAFVRDDTRAWAAIQDCIDQLHWNKERRSTFEKEVTRVRKDVIEPLLSPPPKKRKRAVIHTLADVQEEETEWLWWPYLPYGMFSLLEGDPGIGKSQIALAIAASVTTGDLLPDQQGNPTWRVKGPRDVLFLCAEDSASRTIKKRFSLMGGDDRRFHLLIGFVQEGSDREEEAFTLQHMDVLYDGISQTNPALIVIDPLQSYLGDIDMNRANQTRPLMAALTQAAEATGACIVAIRHPAKASNGVRALYRGLGSVDIIGAARTALFCEYHPLYPHKAILMQSKSNIERFGRAQVIDKSEGQFRWDGVTRINPDLTATTSGPNPAALVEAMFWLEEALSGGVPQMANDIETRAEDEADIAPRTLRRARGRLGVKATLSAVGDAWQWQLPSLSLISPPKEREEGEEADLANTANMANMAFSLEKWEKNDNYAVVKLTVDENGRETQVGQAVRDGQVGQVIIGPGLPGPIDMTQVDSQVLDTTDVYDDLKALFDAASETEAQRWARRRD
jgi:hypothetical protein